MLGVAQGAHEQKSERVVLRPHEFDTAILVGLHFFSNEIQRSLLVASAVVEAWVRVKAPRRCVREVAPVDRR